MSKSVRRVFTGALLTGTAMALMVVPALAVSSSTQDFIDKATVGNQFEISSSRIALQKSQNDDVKTFAQQMVDDHTKAGNDMKTVLTTAGTAPSQPATALDSSHQKMIDKLNKLSGTDFDQKYVSMQVSAHKDTIKLFSKYAKNGDDQPLKDFAGKTLPTLQQHKQHIDQIKASM